MKSLLLVSFLIFMIGCSTPEPVAENKPVEAKPSETGASGTPVASGNPDRIFQLKNLQKVAIKTKATTINSWVMDTEDKRREGMMFLTDKEVEDTEGMIFAFSSVQKADGNRGFWMQHTVLPLDIVYISSDKKVINVGAGKPFSEDVVRAAGDYQYVLEVKAGLALKYGLSPGSKVEIPSEVSSKD